MKKVEKIIAAVTIIALIVFGIIKGIRSLGKLCKGIETDFSKDGYSVGKSVGQIIDAVIGKYIKDSQDIQRGYANRARANRASCVRCLGARILSRLPEPP